MKYAAIMFDVVDSRRYLDRYDIQNLLMSSVEYLNDVYNNAIKKEVVSSAGDEFQGLFRDKGRYQKARNAPCRLREEARQARSFSLCTRQLSDLRFYTRF